MAAALAVAAVATTGCGSDDEPATKKTGAAARTTATAIPPAPATIDAPAPPRDPAAAEVEAAFTAGEQAFLDGDYAAVCAGFTEKYMLGTYEVGPDRCPAELRNLRAAMPAAPERAPITGVEVNGEHANVAVTRGGRSETYVLVRSDNRWRIDGVRSRAR